MNDLCAIMIGLCKTNMKAQPEVCKFWVTCKYGTDLQDIT